MLPFLVLGQLCFKQLYFKLHVLTCVGNLVYLPAQSLATFPNSSLMARKEDLHENELRLGLLCFFILNILGFVFMKKEQVSKLFEWCDGPLVQAMKAGAMFLVDEISLADDSVLERLNSVLEPERTLVLAEKGGGGHSVGEDVDVLIAHKDFKIIGTMNPGGDFGKKEV